MHGKPIALIAATCGLLAQDPPSPPPRPEPMPVPRVVALPRGDRPIAIDGSLVDWPELPAIRLDDQRQLSGTAGMAWRGPQDLSAVAFAMWDADAFYFACVVKDEWHRSLEAAALSLTEVPPADSIVLTIDPDRDTRGIGTHPGRREDREFWLADEQGRQVVQWDRLRGTARVLEGDAGRVVVLHDKERSVTTYEARIEWREILPAGRKAQPGSVFDLQVVVNDFDESTDGMAQTRIGWTFGCSPIVDPGLLGSVMLVDGSALPGGLLPEFPPAPRGEPVESDLRDLIGRLLQVPPAVCDGTRAPEETGGLTRFRVLEEIDGLCERFPRVDFVELHHRIHRRMQREVAGIQATGLAAFWRRRLESVSKNAEDVVPNGSMRLFRLPMGGWLVRMPCGGFVIDPAGADVAEWLWGGCDFCVLTQPLDITRRNDQLLVRMLQAKPPRPVFTHVAFHLPIVSMNDMPLFEPGQSFTVADGADVMALGKKEADGSVRWSCSYVVTAPAGPKLLMAGQNLTATEADVPDVDVLILSPRNPEGLQIVEKLAPRLVVLDEPFQAAAFPNQRRVALRDLHAQQKALQRWPSLVLAPGESWDVTRTAK